MISRRPNVFLLHVKDWKMDVRFRLNKLDDCATCSPFLKEMGRG
jgi:hypothetical protein